MKFTNGAWLVREGGQIAGAHEAHEVIADSNSLTVYAPTRHLYHRGDTLSGPLLTVRLSTPMPGVIRVQTWHFRGQAPTGPQFQLRMETGSWALVEDNDEAATLTSGSLSARVTKKGGWALAFLHQGERITGSKQGNLAYITIQDNGPAAYMREQLDLGVGECIYGLGERFTPFVKNGQVVDIWNADGGTSTEQAYKNIPFYISSRGYGVLVNHPERVSFEVGSENVSRVQFSVAGEYLDYLLIDGPSMKQVLERYTALTGRPALPPAWSFGLWLTTSFLTNYDEATVTSFVDGMAERDIPLHVFHFDCFWMHEFRWCDFCWDTRLFPDPAGMLRRLKEKGLKICVWINPYVAQQSLLFNEGMTKGYFLRKTNGAVWQTDLWQPGMAIVDFTNPRAREWYCAQLARLIDMGVDCLKTDFGERIPTDVVYHDGSDPAKMHNYYAYLYNQTVYNLLADKLGPDQAVLFARSATVGAQKFPVHWGGDCQASYESMAESLRGGLSLCLSGFGFWSHDIGGFEQTATADIYKRWTAFGLLSSHSRLHGSTSYRVPWLFDAEAVDVMRHFTQWKCRLMPYLYGLAYEATQQGTPVMRAMVLEFMDDPACRTLDRQYMLGDALLVAPVFSSTGEVEYYLPAGRWTHLFANEAVAGGSWRQERYNYMSLPLFVRPNTMLPIGSNTIQPDYDYAADVTMHLFALEDGCTARRTVYNTAGRPELTVEARRLGQMITVTSSGAGKPWSLLLRNIHTVADVKGAATATEAAGIRVIPAEGTQTISIILP